MCEQVCESLNFLEKKYTNVKFSNIVGQFGPTVGPTCSSHPHMKELGVLSWEAGTTLP